jgi:hypothetical protein
VPLYSGIGVTLRWTKPPEGVIHQIELAREAGAEGVILFNYSDRLSEDLFPKLGAGVFAQPATLPHRRTKEAGSAPARPHREAAP